jgi:hypothetical protein
MRYHNNAISIGYHAISIGYNSISIGYNSISIGLTISPDTLRYRMIYQYGMGLFSQ